MIPTGMGLMMPAHAPWRAMEFAFVFTMWTVMMVAMMVPSAISMVLMYARVGRHAESRRTPLVATAWFVGGYFLVWVVFALLAMLAQWALERAALLDSAMATTSPIPTNGRASGRMPYPMPDAVCVHDAPRWV
jgi:predicted metal-binding membrane protein